MHLIRLPYLAFGEKRWFLSNESRNVGVFRERAESFSEDGF